MATINHQTTTMEQLRRFAGELAAKLTPGMVVGLVGELGAGKTTFVKELAKVLGVTEEVISPTYIYHQSYRAEGATPELNHFDFYRLNDQSDIEELGIEVGDPQALTLVEWIDKVPELSAKVDLILRFSIENGKREITEIWKNH